MLVGKRSLINFKSEIVIVLKVGETALLVMLFVFCAHACSLSRGINIIQRCVQHGESQI